MPASPLRTRLLITPTILNMLKAQWSSRVSDSDVVMLWATCCVGYFGFMRAGEFIVKNTGEFDQASALILEDVVVDRHENPAMIRIRLKHSKTDPFRQGVDIFLG